MKELNIHIDIRIFPYEELNAADRELIDAALVQGRAGILRHGGHHHLGIGVSYVGQIGGLPALFQLGRKDRDGHPDEDGDDRHHDQQLRQGKAVFAFFHFTVRRLSNHLIWVNNIK